MTTVVGLLGGPGAGKSTRAASLFSQMKEASLHCELVREYVKDWAWEGKKIGKFDQMYFLSKQFRKESILYGKVDFVITDSPFIIAGFYAEYYLGQTFVTDAALNMRRIAEDDGVVFKDFILKRYKEYNPNGRYETEEQAREIDLRMEEFLIRRGINYSYISSPDNEKNNQILSSLIPFHSFQNGGAL